MRVMSTKTTSEINRRRTMNWSNAFAPPPGVALRRLLSDFDSLQAQQAIRDSYEARYLLVQGDKIHTVPEVDNVAPRPQRALRRRLPVQHLRVQRGTLSVIGDGACLLQDVIDCCITHARDILRGATGVEIIDVPVGIDAPAPANQKRLGF